MRGDGCLRYGRCGDAHREAIALLGARAFLGDRAQALRFVDRLGVDVYRAVFLGSDAIARLAFYDFGQWFGGRAVRMAGIGGVAVAPERRGEGVGRLLLTEALREARAGGYALSTLYPASLAFYAKLGYGRGGYFWQWETALAALTGLNASLTVRPATDDDLPSIERVQESQARHSPGHLRRAPLWWSFALKGPEDGAEAWVVEDRDMIRGYVALQAVGKAIDLRDSAFLDGAAAETALAFLAGWRTQVDSLRWRGGPDHPLTLRIPENPIRTVECANWYLRIVDVEQAMAQRGWPGASASLVVEVDDPILPENAGTWRLDVAGGEGRAVRTDAAPDVRLGIAALATLYAGRAPLAALVAAGLAEASDEAAAVSDAIFAGPVPTMLDWF